MKRFASLYVCFLSACSFGCTTLGPMPGMTAVSAVPQQHPDAEVQLARVPGYHLSSATQEDAHGSTMDQLSLLFEPNDWIGVQGLGAGARFVGSEDDGHLEPMLRYRRFLDDDERIAFAVTGFGTHASGADKGASYTLNRGGAEFTLDTRVTPKNSWFELHLLGGSGLIALFADGDYCADSEGFGVECGEGVSGSTHGEVNDVFPTFFVGLGLDGARHLDSAFHSARLAGWLGGGFMPVVQNGELEEKRGWAAAGLGLTLGFGGS